VLIPESNIRHLVLRTDVIQAVAQRNYHIYPVRTIDDGLAARGERVSPKAPEVMVR
jgi:predicted ATP-dependent protease